MKNAWQGRCSAKVKSSGREKEKMGILSENIPLSLLILWNILQGAEWNLTITGRESRGRRKRCPRSQTSCTGS
jgi:hypothetical protein